MMKKYLLAILAVLLLSSHASAAIEPYLDGAVNTRFDFLNWENIGVDGAAPGTLDMGDTLRGVLKLQNNAQQFGSAIDSFLPGSGNSEILAIFEIEVTMKTMVAPGAFEFEFGPNAAFAASNGLPVDTMIAFYTQPNPAVAPTTFDAALNVSVAATEAAVTSGAPLMALGYSTALGDGYWVSNATTDLIPFPLGGSSEFFYGLNLQAGFGIVPSALIGPQTNPFLNPFGHTLPFVAFLNDFVGEGDVTPLPAGNNADAYDLFSDDPALSRLIPEPGAIVVWGLLASIAGVVAYRRRNR